MHARIHPTIARALAPMAPPQSEVHQIIREEDWLAADRAINVNKAERRAQLDADWALAEQQRHLDHGWTA